MVKMLMIFFSSDSDDDDSFILSFFFFWHSLFVCFQHNYIGTEFRLLIFFCLRNISFFSHHHLMDDFNNDDVSMCVCVCWKLFPVFVYLSIICHHHHHQWIYLSNIIIIYPINWIHFHFFFYSIHSFIYRRRRRRCLRFRAYRISWSISISDPSVWSIHSK